MGNICDLSKYQGDIDFSKLSKVVDGVILRVQSGSTNPDPKYTEYVAACKKYNIPFGTYAYFKGLNVADSIQEAKDASSLMDKDSKFFGLDVEEMTLKIPNDIVPASQAFIDYMKKQGVQKVGLYSGEYFYKNYDLDKLKVDFLWLAKYSNNKPSIPCDLWQNTSSGTLDGIVGKVDLDVLSGSKSLDWFFGSPKPVPVAKPVAKNPIPNKIVGNVYKVASGDSLSSISIRAKVSIDNLVKWNNIKNPNVIQVGDILKLKAPAPKSIYHIVVKGETVSELANKFKSSISQIQIWNKLDSKYTIYVGQKLRVK